MSKQNKSKADKAAIKETVKMGFSTLISNPACVEMGRNHKWYAPVIIGLLSVFLAVLPIGIARGSTKGSDFFTSPTYGYEYGLVHFLEDADKFNRDADTDNDITIRVNAAAKTLTATNFPELYADTSGHSFYQHKDGTTVTFEVFYTSNVGDDYSSFVKEIVTNKVNPYNTAETRDYYCNLLILGRESFSSYTYKVGATSATQSLTGKYDVAKSFNIVSPDHQDLLNQDSHGTAYSVPYTSVTKDNYDTWLTSNLEAWKLFYTDAYNSTKVTATWTWIGIMAAVFAGFTIFMGLMVFLMTRGKNNPYKIYTFWETQKIAYWASLSPAILAMILSFFLSNFAMFFYIFLYGMRMMWLSMKTLRPESK